MSDLKTSDGDFTKAVRDNTNGRIIFSTGDSDTLDEMVKLSGVEDRQRAKWPVLVDDYLLGSTGPGASATGEILTDAAQEPRLTREHLQHMSAEQMLGFVQLKKNIGYSWFGSTGFIARFRFPITREEFTERNKEVWPGGPGTFIPNFDDPPQTSAKSKLPTGPTRDPQSGRGSPVPPTDPVNPGSLLDQLAAEPAFGPRQPTEKSKRGKPKRAEPQDQTKKPTEDGQ
jgi:hypothetical protein